MVAVNIVVKTVINGRTDGELCIRIQFFYGVGHDMGGAVAIDFEKFLIAFRFF